jgi:hypothetical protein
MSAVLVGSWDALFAIHEGSFLFADGRSGLLLQVLDRVGVVGSWPGRYGKLGFEADFLEPQADGVVDAANRATGAVLGAWGNRLLDLAIVEGISRILELENSICPFGE